MVERIVLTGAECTGKTTLARALSDYFGEPWTAEFVRDYAARLDRPLAAEDLEPIGRGQLRREDEGAARARRFVFHDTNLLSSIIYARHYFATEIEWLNEAFFARDYALYFLCLPDFPWSPDPGQREGAGVRETLQGTFRRSLERLELPFVTVSGSPEARLHTAARILGSRSGKGPAGG